MRVPVNSRAGAVVCEAKRSNHVIPVLTAKSLGCVRERQRRPLQKGVHGIARAKQQAKDVTAAKPAPLATRWAREDEDVQLMLRVRDGDHRAFEELVVRNTPRVHALVYRFLGDPGMVEDLTQEVFLRIYRTAPRYQPAAKFSTWLYRIVANLAFNVLRDRKKAREVQLDSSASSDDDGDGFYRNLPDEDGPAPERSLDDRELSERITLAIDALPDTQRLAIVLNKYEDMSYEDIADILDCSTMAVKSLLSRARGNLRESLERYLRTGQ